MFFCKILCEQVTFRHIKICQNTYFLKWKCRCIIFYMMLRVAMSSTKNVLDFGLNFLSKTCLWGLIKMSLFGVLFLYQFWIKFGCILTALTPKIHQKWGVTLDTMDYGHWPKGFSLKILRNSCYRPLAIIEPMLQSRFLIDFWSLQDVSKASEDASRWLQNVTKRQQFTLHIA